MTVQELIDILQKIPDKDSDIWYEEEVDYGTGYYIKKSSPDPCKKGDYYLL